MHIVFISTKEQHFKNDELLKSNRFIKWNDNVYSHLELGSEIPACNLTLYFGQAFKAKYPEQELYKFFMDGEYFTTSFPDYKQYDTFTKTEQNKEFKIFRSRVNKMFERFCLVKVTNWKIYYKDVNFKTQTYKNEHKSDVMYIENPNGEFISIHFPGNWC